MEENNMYTPQQVEEIARQAARYVIEHSLHPPNLDNEIESPPKGDTTMAKYMREKVTIRGEVKWIGGYTQQELMDAYVRLLEKEGILIRVADDLAVPQFGEYLDRFYKTCRANQQDNTLVNRQRIVKNHIIPAFGMQPVDKISTMDLQEYFNNLGKKYAKETVLKIRNMMNPVFNAAVEDELIKRNPLDSDRIKITGKETVSHKAIPKEKMDGIKEALPSLTGRVLIMTALLCYTGMRFEEILGLKWEDISDGWIEIQRAVVHPTRGQPVVKDPKTKTSQRRIPYIQRLKDLLEPHRTTGYLLSKEGDGKDPLSYAEARRVFEKIRKQFDLQGFSAHDFRDTCATEWREAGIELDVIARLLGHAKTETTERKYVKYRNDLVLQSVAALNAL